MSEQIPEDAPRPRLCHLRRWVDFNGYGFNLHAEKGKVGHFVGQVDLDSPSDYAGLKEGDRIVEVNGTNIGNENHQQVVTRIKAVPGEVKLLVMDLETEDYYKDRRITVRGDMENVWIRDVPLARPSGKDSPTVPRPEKPNGTDTPRVRLCHIHAHSDFQGYGFNLHAEKKKVGQFIGKIDPDSPAEEGGLQEGDRIIEINGMNIREDNHQEVVQRIKSLPGTVNMLVVNPVADRYFTDRGILVFGGMENILVINDRSQKIHEAAVAAAAASHVEPPPPDTSAEDDDHPHNPRRCLVKKWPDFQGYGFHLHAEKGKAGHFIGGIEDDSPAEAAHLKAKDKIIEVNGENVQDSNHQVTVEKIKANPQQVELLVLDPQADEYFHNAGINIHSGMRCVVYHETPDRMLGTPEPEPHRDSSPEPEPEHEPPPPEVAALTVAAVAIANADAHDDERYPPRRCLIMKWHDFQGYGFNLHAEKGKAGHYIGSIDPGSPAEAGGLRPDDVIVEVNGESIEHDSHQSLVQKIKSNPGQVMLLVVDPETKEYYQSRDTRVHGGMPHVIYHECPVHEEPSQLNGQVAQVQFNSTPVAHEPEPEPPKPEPTPAPAPAPAKAPDSLGMASSAAEARERLSRKKKTDPRTQNMTLQEKYKLFQDL